jgi:WD40 repeat protein
VAFSPDGRSILTDSAPLQLWETSSGRKLASLKDGYGKRIAFSPDGSSAIAVHKQRIYIWQVTQSKVGELSAFYVAQHNIKAFHWQDATHLVLVGDDRLGGWPCLSSLAFERML